MVQTLSSNGKSNTTHLCWQRLPSRGALPLPQRKGPLRDVPREEWDDYYKPDDDELWHKYYKQLADED